MSLCVCVHYIPQNYPIRPCHAIVNMCYNTCIDAPSELVKRSRIVVTKCMCLGVCTLALPVDVAKVDIDFARPFGEQISRTEVFLTGIIDTDARVDSLLDARDVANQSDLQPKPFAFTTIFIFVEQVYYSTSLYIHCIRK